MSEDLDGRVLDLLSRLAVEDRGADLKLSQGLWRDRQILVDSMRAIKDWNIMSSEALSVERAQEIASKALETVDEL